MIKNLKADNRQKTATILQTAKTSFQHFFCGQDISLDKIDKDLIQKYENHLKHKAITRMTD